MSTLFFVIVIVCSVRAGILDKLSIDILDPNIADYLTDKEMGCLRLVNKKFNQNIDRKYQQRLSSAIHLFLEI